MLAVSNGFVTLSDKRKKLNTTDQYEVYWDCDRHAEFLRSGVVLDEGIGDIGKPKLMYLCEHRGKAGIVFFSLWRNFKHSPRVTATKLLAFSSLQSFSFELMMVFDSAYVVTLSLSRSDDFEITYAPPGELSKIGRGLWPSQNFCPQGATIDDKTLHDYYLASAAVEKEHSINFDRMTIKDGELAAEFDIRPTIEEEQQAVKDFFHPRYELEPAKRYYWKARF